MSKSSAVDRGMSVLIPVHGNAEFILEAVDSVLLQLNVEFEIILILDRVTFSCLERLKSVADDPLIRIIESSKPGISNALNLGARSSRYNILARLDSDDLMAPHRLSKQLQLLVNSPNINVVGSSIQLIDAENHLLGTKKFPTKSSQIQDLLQYRNCIAHPAVMMRKSVFMALNGYRPEFEPAEDYDLWLRMSAQHEFGFFSIPEPLTLYRIHSSQVSAMNRIRQLRVSRIMAKSFRFGYEMYSSLSFDIDSHSSRKIDLDVLLIRWYEESSSNVFKKYLGLLIFCVINPLETYYFLLGKVR